MSYLYATRTIQLPVRAVGTNIIDAWECIVATAFDSFQAEALAMLINAGKAECERQDAEHDEREGNLLRGLLRSRQSPEGY